MKFKNLAGALAAGALALSAFVGSAGHALAQEKGLIAFSQSALENEWRVLNSQDMQRAAEEAGYEFITTNANGDPAQQLADIETLLARGPDLLVVAPVEFEPLAPVPDLAARAGVPLIVIDRAIPGEPGVGDWISLIEVDFTDHGVQIGEEIVADMILKHGEPRGRILHITGITGASTEINMTEGMMNVLDQYPDIEVVASCDGRYQEEPGRTCMENFLQRFPAGEVDGVICGNDYECFGAIAAMETAGRMEMLGAIWSQGGAKRALEYMVRPIEDDTNPFDTWYSISVQTPPNYGDTTIATFEAWQADPGSVESRVALPKETFDNDTEAQLQRTADRIVELEELGVGCC